MLQLGSFNSVMAQDGLLEDAAEFSPARYAPMAHLMSDEDLLFLKSQPGFRPEMGKKFSRDRRRIFRAYLKELTRDFHRLHAHARVIVASLPAEHSNLVGVLLRQQVRFWYAMAVIEIRLSFYWTGAGNIEVRGLVDALGSMHAEISRLSAPMAA